jgi:hypothetical protein
MSNAPVLKLDCPLSRSEMGTSIALKLQNRNIYARVIYRFSSNVSFLGA